jgi:hypothetical protein
MGTLVKKNLHLSQWAERNNKNPATFYGWKQIKKYIKAWNLGNHPWGRRALYSVLWLISCTLLFSPLKNRRKSCVGVGSILLWIQTQCCKVFLSLFFAESNHPIKAPLKKRVSMLS